MKIRFRTVLLALITGLALVLATTPADARRLGGGLNLGKQVPTHSYQYSTPTATRPTTQSQVSPSISAPPARTGVSRWLGPIAGLAAGGLLGAMFFGGAFSGIHLMDIIVIGIIIGGIFLLIRAFRSPAVTEEQQPAAWSPADNQGAPMQSRPISGTDFGSNRFGGAPARDPRLDDFDQEGFLKAASSYFVQLQAAWDANRMNEIQEFVTPDLFRSLVDERARTQEKNVTEVVQLQTDMQSLTIEGNLIVASVLFSGYIRESVWEAPQPFNELWNIQKSLTTPSATWLIAGIQQTS